MTGEADGCRINRIEHHTRGVIWSVWGPDEARIAAAFLQFVLVIQPNIRGDTPLGGRDSNTEGDDE